MTAPTYDGLTLFFLGLVLTGAAFIIGGCIYVAYCWVRDVFRRIDRENRAAKLAAEWAEISARPHKVGNVSFLRKTPKWQHMQQPVPKTDVHGGARRK